jgi:hypothetical protein
MVVGGAFYSERKARAIFEVWRDKEMEDWTIIVTTLDGLSCMLGSGKGVVPVGNYKLAGDRRVVRLGISPNRCG